MPRPMPLQRPWLRPAPDLLTWVVGQGQPGTPSVPPPARSSSGKQGLPSIPSAEHAGCSWWVVPWEQGDHPSFLLMLHFYLHTRQVHPTEFLKPLVWPFLGAHVQREKPHSLLSRTLVLSD